MQDNSLQDIGHYGTRTHKPEGERNHVAEIMMLNFRRSGYPVFRGSSWFNRGTLKSKGGGKLSIHYYGDSDTAELIFRTIVSVIQLSIYGAVSDWCEELAQRISDSAGGPAPKDEPESLMEPTVVSTSTNPLLTDSPEQGNLLRRHRKRAPTEAS